MKETTLTLLEKLASRTQFAPHSFADPPTERFAQHSRA